MFSVCIQAGGNSTRMGMDKGLMLFNGQPLALRIARRFEHHSPDIFMVSNQASQYQSLGFPVHSDHQPGQGPLGGLFTALHLAQQPLVAVVACDMPFANPALLAYMASIAESEKADVVIPRLNGQYEPLHAIYRRQPCLAYIDEALQSGERRAIGWFPKASIHPIGADQIRLHDPHSITFTNVNTPAEFSLAERVDLALDQHHSA